MWFGLGKSKAHFGQEEFCLCSGLKMGQLPEGFANNNEVEEDSMLRRIFKGKRPTAEVWAVEREISLENLVGKRVATEYPRFGRWEFSAKTALFDWDVETFEKGTDYFKSLNLEYVYGPLIDKKREKLALPRSEEEEDLGSDHEGDDNQTGNDNDGIDCSIKKEEIEGSVERTRSTFSNEYFPISKKQLFSYRNPKVPSTIPELYDAMLESKQCIIAFCREEFLKIRKEMKNGDEQADDVVDDKGARNNVTVVKDVEELNSVGKVGELGKEKDDDVGDGNAAFEGCKGDEQENGVGENGKGSEQGVGSDGLVVGDAAFEGGKGDEQEDGVGEIGKGSKEGVGSDCVVVADDAFEGGKGDDQKDAAVGEIGTGCDQGVGSDGVVVGDATFEGDMVEELGKKSILDLDEYPSPSVCFIAQNNPSSVVSLDGADPDVKYRDIDKQRGRKRSRLYVTYSLMYITTFTQHIHSYFDIVWRRQSSSELNYLQNIGLVNTSFFVLILCHLPGHWVLCHVLFKEGKVLLFDSLNERDRTSHRLKDVRALLYLLPSLPKLAGYYEEMKMDPHASPFTVQRMGSELIPQQDDGYSCGVFLMKYAELILAGVKTPWKSVFGQKDIKDIRKAIVIDIYTNGQPCNSP
ncbi:hypothetical protein Dsin_001888 [Dipteronia sinensis]|uniref:Ubiquitin-like protease family profile domain-containing protein n=1 Tax=Dipteronia sinensis TaxID=43782 RepID=A0AAE0B651_9ROSI|nr:hypothetical protein Dsin_001888 [Dipteronia sinensis]